jgi:hypothetical protein
LPISLAAWSTALVISCMSTSETISKVGIIGSVLKPAF